MRVVWTFGLSLLAVVSLYLRKLLHTSSHSDSSHFRFKGKAKTYEKSLFFYADFARALEKIAQVKAEMGNFDSLEEYIENYKSISINIKNYTDGIRGAI